ncbi:MAG: ABC transporter permease [Acidobacteriia bacterium]|nr:ABC transporter permease [Terriglobia bacterium]
MNTLLQDLRYGLRLLGKSPGFTAIAVLTLALGIGANTAIFTVVNSVLLRPLAFRHPEQLYLIRNIVPQFSRIYPSFGANVPDFRIWQKECRSFDEIAIVNSTSMTLTGQGPAEEIEIGKASSNLFALLGVHPVLGRSFVSEEDNPGRDRVVLMTDHFWRTRFHENPSVIGQSVTLDGKSYEVVGILPASFHLPREMGTLVSLGSRIDLFKPLGVDVANAGLIGDFDFAAVARLKAGVSREQALAELNLVQARIAADAKQGFDLRGDLWPLQATVVGPARRGLLFLLAAVGAVLLIVCVNLANLMLARLPGRMRELAIRTSLGATRKRLLSQMFTESALLSVLGAALGLWLADFGVGWLARAAAQSVPRIEEITMDARVFGFAAFLAIFTAALFGILPALKATGVSPHDTLKTCASSTTESRKTRRLRESLIGVEVGLSAALLILAGLLTTSLIHLLRVNAGFAVEHVLAADIKLPPQSYSEASARQKFYDEVLRRVQMLPGVASTAWVNLLPLEGQGSVCDIRRPGDERTGGKVPLANFRAISPGYFHTMNIPLLAGRDVSEGDRRRSVVVISKSVAQRLWPGANPIGQTCITSWGGEQNAEVVGVVDDIRTERLDEPPLLMVYTPNSHAEPTAAAPASASIVLRTTSDPAGMAGALRAVLQNLDPNVPIVQLRPMKELVSKSVEGRRFQMSLALLFAFSALLLASLGIFGVVAYSVEQRRHELGIRLAMGAQESDLRRMVLRQGMIPTFAGLAGGIAAAVLSGRGIENLLYGVRPMDPPTVMVVASVIVAVSLVACWIPARRATKVDPMVALRYE